MLELDVLLVLAVTYKEQTDSSVAVNCKNLCRILSLYHHPGIPLRETEIITKCKCIKMTINTFIT